MFLTYVCAVLFNFQTKNCRDLGFIIPPIAQSHSLLTTGSNQNDILDGQNINLLVWNIYKSEKKGWLEDYTRLGKNNDLMLIQEAHLNTTFLESINTLPEYTFTHDTSFIFKEDGIATGTLIGSKYKIAESGIIRSTDTEPFIHTPKTISVAKLPLVNSREQLLLLNIHGLNATKTKSFQSQIESTSSIIRNHQGPIIFAGDFNTRNKKRIKLLNRFMNQHQFTEVTYENDQRMNFLGHPLDHVYVRNLEIISSNVRGDVISSDHKALEVKLRVN